MIASWLRLPGGATPIPPLLYAWLAVNALCTLIQVPLFWKTIQQRQQWKRDGADPDRLLLVRRDYLTAGFRLTFIVGFFLIGVWRVFVPVPPPRDRDEAIAAGATALFFLVWEVTQACLSGFDLYIRSTWQRVRTGRTIPRVDVDPS